MAGIAGGCKLLVAHPREHWQARSCDAQGTSPGVGQIYICELGKDLSEGAADFFKNVLWKLCAIAFPTAKDKSIVIAKAIIVQYKPIVGYGNVLGQHRFWIL